MVEHWSPKPGVASSSLAAPARIMVKKVLFSIFGIVLFSFWVILFTTDVLIHNLNVKPDRDFLSFCETSDTEAPTIILNGDKVVTIKLGEGYVDEGADVFDDCDEVEITKSGEVDTNTAGLYTISYSAIDHSSNQNSVERIVRVIPEYRGTIYLTFDDGPGNYTAELLDILAKYNVKATFFVTGYGDDAMIVREYNEGHAIGLHTSSHDYSYIYQSTDAFFDDLYRVQERVKNLTGYTSYLMRFPGGSSNTVSTRYDGGTRIMSRLVRLVEEKGFTYFDWNISSGDAGNTTSSDVVYQNVVYALKEGGSSVVLQHDVKGFSVAAVERIIQYGLANGYEFQKLDASSFTAHHRVNN